MVMRSAMGIAAILALGGCDAILAIPDRTLDPNLTCTDEGCQCKSGFASCDGEGSGCTTDLSSDPESCGACGRSCLGGACEQGRCQQTLLLEEGNLGDLVVAGGHVYFTSRIGNPIRRIPTGGGSVEPVPGTTPGFMLREDAGILYWTTPTQLLSIPLDGGASARVVADGVTPVDDMAIGGGLVYFINYVIEFPNYLMASVPVGGGTAEILGQIDPMDEPWSVVATASRVYWSIPDGIVSTQHGAMSPARLGQVFGLPYRLARDEASLYWINSGIYTMPLTGATQLKLAPASPFGTLTVFGDDIFFATDTGTLETVPKTGGEPVVLATSQKFAPAFPSHIAVDDRAIYWIADDGIHLLVR